MRIRRIDLAAYGKFTDASLDFGERDGRIHVVYGPNEAGKSTLLRAIWAFFYGDLKKSKDDYQHAAANLRIGMALEPASGGVVSLTRRGGVSGPQSLRDEADRAVPAADLQKLLGEVSEAAFKQQFAIDHEQLRRGSQLLYDQKGELGAALFAAASGVTAIARVTSELDEEAEAIFTPSGRKKPFNETANRLATLKKSLRESVVSTAKYNEVRRLRDEAARRAGALGAERAACLDRSSRLQRIVAGIPKVVRLKELSAELALLPPAPALGENFGLRRQNAIAAKQRAQALIDEGTMRLETLRVQRQSLSPSAAAVELLPSLQELIGTHGSYVKAQSDRKRLEIEMAQSKRAEAEARRALCGVHEGATAPPASDLRHFRSRLDEYRRLAGELRSLEREIATTEAQLAELKHDSNEAEEVKDLRPLKGAVETTLRRANLDEQIERLALQVRQLEQSTSQELQSLAIELSAEEFLARELPSIAKIADFDRRANRLEKQAEETERRIKELTTAKEEIGCRLAALLGDGEVPTEADVTQARVERDALWKEIRERAGAAAESAVKTPLLKKLDDSLFERFEAAVRKADRLADLLRSESERIAERNRLVSDQLLAGGKLDSESKALAKLEVERETFTREWQDFLAAVPTRPRPPAELKEWQPAALRLQDQLRKLQNLRAEAEQLGEVEKRLMKELAEGAALAGVTLNGQSLIDNLAEAQERLREIENAQNRRAAAKGQVAQMAGRLAEARRKLEIEKPQVEAHWRDLQAALIGWKCGEVASASEIERILPVLEEVERLGAEMREKAARIEGIDRDATTFQKRLVQAASALGMSSDFDGAMDLFAAVKERLEEAQRQLHQAKELDRQIGDLESSLADHRNTLALAQSELNALMLEAGTDSIDRLGYIESEAERRRDREKEQRAQLSELEGLFEEQTREAFTAECEATDALAARRQIAELASQAAELESQIDAERETLRVHDAWLRENPTLEQVARDEEAMQETLSELRSLVREHVKSRLASEVLLRAMRRYREENQGELLKSGGEIFSRLTGGTYQGIRSEISESGVAELFAARNGQPHVPLSQLSDGARDQLYLALRLATLRQHFGSHPPMPFIVDDIFVMFDEGRTLAALQELARLGEITQVIVLTHHAHVLELALSGLGESQCATHELLQTGAARASAQVNSAQETEAEVHEAHTKVKKPRGKKAEVSS